MIKRKRYSETDKAKIEIIYLQTNFGIHYIARMFNTCCGTIRYILNKRKVIMNKKGGGCGRGIGNKNVNSTDLKIAEEILCRKLPTNFLNAPPEKYSEIEKTKIIKIYLQTHFGQNYIAKMLNTDKSGIFQLLLKEKIPKHKNQGGDPKHFIGNKHIKQEDIIIAEEILCKKLPPDFLSGGWRMANGVEVKQT
jgi:hypothetical protein